MYDAYISSTLLASPSTVNSEAISYRYRELLKKIILYVSQEDIENQRFLKNIDFNKKEDIAIILPYYIKRITRSTNSKQYVSLGTFTLNQSGVYFIE